MCIVPVWYTRTHLSGVFKFNLTMSDFTRSPHQILCDLGYSKAVADAALKDAGSGDIERAMQHCSEAVGRNVSAYRAEAERTRRLLRDANAKPFNIMLFPRDAYDPEIMEFKVQNRCNFDIVLTVSKVEYKLECPNSVYSIGEFEIDVGGCCQSPSFRIYLDPLETRTYGVRLKDIRDQSICFRLTIKEISSAVELTEEAINTLRPTTAIVVPLDAADTPQQAAVRALAVGDIFYVSRFGEDSGCGRGLELYYGRLSDMDMAAKFSSRAPVHGSGKQALSSSAPVSARTYGTTCPSCGSQLQELMRYTSSDGMMGIFRDLWACPINSCRVIRVCSYEGYGDV